MSGISSGGVISGIDTQGLIQQLLQIEARPINLANTRVNQLGRQQDAYDRISGLLGGLGSASSTFRTSNSFQQNTATSSRPSALTATATSAAAEGTTRVLVDRLVSTQQALSRGFVDRDESPFGADSITFEPAAGRIDNTTPLGQLNGDTGIVRGIINIEDAQGENADIDLSRVATVDEVLDAINSADGIDVTASVSGGRFILEGAEDVTDADGRGTAASLGLDLGDGVTSADDADANGDDSVVTGEAVLSLAGSTLLSSLNDGNGVDVSSDRTASRSDFTIRIKKPSDSDFTDVNVNIGPVFELQTDDDGVSSFEQVEAAPKTVQGVVDRINEALSDAGFDSTAQIDSESNRLLILPDSLETFEVVEDEGNTARDLGLANIGGGNIFGDTVLAGMNDVLLRSLGGGGNQNVPGDGLIDFTLRDGTSFTADVSAATSLSEAIDMINDAGNAAVSDAADFSVAIRENGTGLEVTDTTAATGSLTITGTGGDDTAAALGISTGPGGVNAESFSGRAQRRFISEGTRLEDLRGGRGIGTGQVEIFQANGAVRRVTIDDSFSTVRDLLDAFDSADIDARINDNGDGILIEDSTGTGGPISISDVSGRVAENLNLDREAAGAGADNFIDGSFETRVEFEADDTLDDAIAKINEADPGLSALVVSDGGASRPFRISFTSDTAGEAGRFTVDAEGIDLGLDTIDEGQNARAFVGGTTAANSLLVTSTDNTVDDAVIGLDIDLLGTTNGFEEITVARDTGGIIEQVNAFVDAYNALLDGIDRATFFDEETGEEGALLGDGTVLALERELTRRLNGSNESRNGVFDTLASIGIRTVNDGGGRIELDEAAFRDALERDAEAVEELFTRRDGQTDDGVLETDEDGNPLIIDEGVSGRVTFTNLGVIPQIEALADRFTDPITGTLTRRNESLDSQIETINERIERLNEGLVREQQRLESQFVAMEQALAQLQNQQSALLQIQPL